MKNEDMKYEIRNQNKNKMKWDRAFNIKRYATLQCLMIRYKIKEYKMMDTSINTEEANGIKRSGEYET